MRNLVIVLLFICCANIAKCQTVFISGIVLDSATLQSLPYTAVQIKGKATGQATKEDGSFLITCQKGDTIVFSRLGYNPYLFIAYKSEGPFKVYLAEDARMLKEVTVYDDYQIAGMEEAKKTLPSDARVKLQDQGLEPPPNSVATFGPTLTIGLGGKDKQQNKRDEFSKTEVYRNVVNSPDVKKYLMDLYKISEDTFYQKLEKFNKANPDAAYLTNKEEILNMLIQFFAIK